MKKSISGTRFIFPIFAAVILAKATLLQAGTDPWASSYALETDGQYQPAAALMVPLLEKSDTHEMALLRYAWLNYLQGNFNDAIEGYTTSLKQNPLSLDAQLGITLPLMAQQRWQEAARHAEQVIAESVWNYTAHIRLLVCEEGLHDWSTLQKHASKLTQRYPSDTSAWVYLARAEIGLDNLEAAKQAYKQVLIRYPGHIEAEGFVKR